MADDVAIPSEYRELGNLGTRPPQRHIEVGAVT
jgi:hypothetical protein